MVRWTVLFPTFSSEYRMSALKSPGDQTRRSVGPIVSDRSAPPFSEYRIHETPSGSATLPSRLYRSCD